MESKSLNGNPTVNFWLDKKELAIIKKIIFLTTLILIIILSGIVLAADRDIKEKLLVDLFNLEDNLVTDLFDSSFLEQVPAEKVVEILDMYKSTLGSLKEVTTTEGGYNLVFEKGNAPATIVLNKDNQITGLWFGMWTLTEDSADSILALFEEMAGAVSVCVIKDNQEILLDYNADQPLAVGSAFKLYILQAVYDQVRAGNISWDSLLLINQENQSFPSGILQDWPVQTPLTVKTLTNLMISISDNTATDHLLDYIGREKIEEYVPAVTKPFLKTVEAFKIKYSLEPERQKKYIRGDLAEKRDMLNELKDYELDINRLVHDFPTLIEEVEWFFTTKELCQVIYALRAAEELRINPGLVEAAKWHIAGYKGGSEPGVLQYTHLLQKGKEESVYAIAVTVNNPADLVDSALVTELTIRLISLIEQGKL